MLKMTISTSVWGAQHPNAGQNIQHLILLEFCVEENCPAKTALKPFLNGSWQAKKSLICTNPPLLQAPD